MTHDISKDNLMTDERALKLAVDRAALKWCGEKDRETFSSDVAYFKHNWRALPGLRKYVDEALAHLPADGGENAPEG